MQADEVICKVRRYIVDENGSTSTVISNLLFKDLDDKSKIIMDNRATVTHIGYHNATSSLYDVIHKITPPENTKPEYIDKLGGWMFTEPMPAATVKCIVGAKPEKIDALFV